MHLSQWSRSRKILAAVVAAAVLILAIWLTAARSSDTAQFTVGHSATIEGEFVCMPHAATGPQTEECAYGVKTANGAYYRVQYGKDYLVTGAINVGDRVRAKGIFQKSNNIYKSSGDIVVNSLEKL